MRSTCEIVADLKDGKEPTYEELKAAMRKFREMKRKYGWK